MVNPSHKVYVVLWDTPEFIQEKSQIQPMEMKTVSAKSDTVRFNDVKSNPVYVGAVYDPTGTWNAKSPPLPASSLGLYAKQRHTPEPIQLSHGKTVTISLTFADSFRFLQVHPHLPPSSDLTLRALEVFISNYLK